MIKTMKKAIDWYSNKATATNVWTPSCMIPNSKESL